MNTIACASLPDDPPRRPSSNAGPFRNGQPTCYGSGDLAQKANQIVDRRIITPELDLKGLRATAIASGRAGESSVRETSSRAFGAANNQHVEEIHGLIRLMDSAIKGVLRNLTEISAEMEKTPRYIRTQRDGTPWTTADRVKLWFFILLSILLLGVGINTNATVLMSSGIRGFETPIRAYLFSMIPIGIAAGIKAIASFIESTANRRIYTVSVWLVGLFFGGLWAKLFADTFRGLTQSAADIVVSLTDPVLASSLGPSNNIFVFVAITAEAFLAAGAWLTAQAIAEKHELDSREDNPAYTKLQSDLDLWTKIQHEYAQILGRLNGKLQAIEDQSRHFIEQAVNTFRVALKACADNQRLDDLFDP